MCCGVVGYGADAVPATAGSRAVDAMDAMGEVHVMVEKTATSGMGATDKASNSIVVGMKGRAAWTCVWWSVSWPRTQFHCAVPLRPGPTLQARQHGPHPRFWVLATPGHP